MRAKRSAFDAWFREQFGPRRKLLDVSDEELRKMVRMGKRAADEIHLREIHAAQETAALYAWNARGKKDAL